MKKTAARRLLLLEFLCHRDDRCESSMFYPYLKGVARDCGAASLWLFFVGRPRFSWERPIGRTLRADIPDEDIAILQGRLKSFRPTHVVSNEIPAPRLRAVIAAAGISNFLVLPGDSDLMAIPWGKHQEEMDPYFTLLSNDPTDRRFIHRPAWFADWLGAGSHPRERENLVEAAAPDYEAVQANDAVDFKPGFPMILVGGQSCKGRPTVAGNPRFQHLGGIERFPPGCSFCGGLDEKSVPRYHRQDSLDLAASQLRALSSADPGRSRSRGVYMVHDLGLFMRIDAFFQMVRKNGFRPAKFIFCPRIDDVLQARERIESILPLAAEGEHRIAFDIMGLENFSPETMVLYNKNISVAQADELAALMDRWHLEWPKIFSPFHGGKNWLMLLFTPWTTLAELRVNYEAAARRGFDSDQYWICTSLLLRRGSSLAALAEQEGGIITPEFPDRGQLFFPICGMPAMWDSIPWRFQDARVADFFRIIIRIFVALVRSEAGPLFGDDPEFALFPRIYCDMPAASGAALRRPPWALLDVARALLDLIEAAPAPWSREALLREAVARVKKAAPVPLALATGASVSGARRPPGPGETGPAPATPLVPLRPLEGSAIDGVRRLLRKRSVSRLGRLTIESAGRDPGDEPAISLGLLLDGREVGIELWDRGHPGPSFFTTRLFKVRYRKIALDWTPDAAAAGRLRLLVVLIERRIEALRRPC